MGVLGKHKHSDHSIGICEKNNVRYLLNVHLQKTVQNYPETLSPDLQEAYIGKSNI